MAKAEELDRLSQSCQIEDMRAVFTRIAFGWRRTAALALQQEQLSVQPLPA